MVRAWFQFGRRLGGCPELKISAISCPYCGDDQWLKIRRESYPVLVPDDWWLDCMACHLRIDLPGGCFEERPRILHIVRPERSFEHELLGDTCGCRPRRELSLGREFGVEVMVHFDLVVPH